MIKIMILFFMVSFLTMSIYSAESIKGPIKMGITDNSVLNDVKNQLLSKYGESQKFRIERGVNQVASFWMDKDGNLEDFKNFCLGNFISKSEDLDVAFSTIQKNSETLNGYFNKIRIDLSFPMQVVTSPQVSPLEMMYASYDASAHITDDFFDNKIAFYVVLNFPFYTLSEKNNLGKNWTRKEWAFARVGDMFTSRTPSSLLLKYSEINTASDQYIADYNIMMGSLIDDAGKSYFPKEMKLISHWNLRDEIKANYNKDGGLAKQKMVYDVMKKIVSQEIPENVINNDKLLWNPKSNKVMENGKEISFKSEPNTRYQQIINNFNALKAIDPYSPSYPTYIDRKFELEMEMSYNDVENLFVDFISSPQIKEVAKLIKNRLGRNLEPFDIWYDGFKSRSNINQDELNKITKAKYPNTEAFHTDMVRILVDLGFDLKNAQFIYENVAVDNSRGAGHASGAYIKGDKARLRTRIGEGGMDYKGYNIAVHEFGHNMEQTTTLNDIDYYMLGGVPNTAFTEAMAFIFQSRDLFLLGKSTNNPLEKHLAALDNLWSSYEIMGVALVDMKVWKWLYQNPNANSEQLKIEVLKICKEVWNQYYADVFGMKDETILGIYSHMISYPLYLSAYPIGHLVEFSLEKEMEGKVLGKELRKFLLQGRITPYHWMIGATGNPLSGKATMDAVLEALKVVK